MLKKIKDLYKNDGWRPFCNKQEKCKDCPAHFDDGEFYGCKFDDMTTYGEDEIEVDETNIIKETP